MISRTLQTLNGQGRLTVRQFEEATGLSDSTFYRWLGGETAIDATALQLLIGHHPDIDVRRAIAAVMLAGSGLCVEELIPDGELDSNGDGQVNLFDALDECSKTQHSVATISGNLSVQLRKQGHPRIQRRLTEHECDEFARISAIAQRSLKRTAQIVAAHHQDNSRRRKARPVAIGGGK